MAIHSDNFWAAREGRNAAIKSDPVTITFDGTSAKGAILTKASVTLTSDATAPSDGDTVTIGGQVYTFKTALTASTTANEVLIGVSAATALDNIGAAVTATTGSGTTFGSETVANEFVDSSTNADTTQLFLAKTAGIAGNAIMVSTDSAHLTFGEGVTALSGGKEGDIPLFTAVGDSLIAIIANCSTDLAGATATYEVGVSGATAKYIPQTTATNFDAGETADITGIVTAGTALVKTPSQYVMDGQTIELKVGTAAITGGVVKFIVYSEEIDDDAKIIKA